jgi:hypothetical protein
MLTKMKVTARDSIFYDGRLVTNGKWAALASCVQLSDKGLQALIDSGTHFQRVSGKMTIGDEGPDTARVFVGEAIEADRLAFTRLSLDIHDNYTGCKCAVWKHPSGRLVVISETCSALLDSADEVYRGNAARAVACFNVTRGDPIARELVAVVMPMGDKATADAGEAIRKAVEGL